MFRFDRFEDLRVQKGVSKKFIADAIGRSAQIIQDWKNPNKTVEPSKDQLLIVARILDTTPEYLRGEEDKYGLSDFDWATMGTSFKRCRENAGKTIDEIADGEVVSSKNVEEFEDNGRQLTPAQLTTICGMVGIDPTVVFEVWADRIWGQKNSIAAKIDDDALDYAQSVHDRPELKVLFKKGKKATAEKLSAILALLEDGSEN